MPCPRSGYVALGSSMVLSALVVIWNCRCLLKWNLQGLWMVDWLIYWWRVSYDRQQYCSRVQLKRDGTRWRTGGEMKGKLENGVGSQYSHATSEHGISSITTTDPHTSAASSRLNWCPRRFKWTRPFRRKTISGFCACAITFQTQSTANKRWTLHGPWLLTEMKLKLLKLSMLVLLIRRMCWVGFTFRKASDYC